MAEKKKKEEKPPEAAPAAPKEPKEKKEPKVEAAKAEETKPEATKVETPAEKKERPLGPSLGARPTPEVLEKLTTIKLRELALAHYPQVVGVSGMKKEQLVEAIKAVEVELGLREPEKKKVTKVETKDLKQMIKALKVKKSEVLAAKDKEQLKAVRTRIKRLKRRIKKIKIKAA